MTLRDRIVAIIESSLEPDETILPPAELDRINHLILAAGELASKAGDILGAEGDDYVSHVQSLIGQLPLATPLHKVFPKAKNLIPFLHLANKLAPDELDDEAPDASNISAYETDLEAFTKTGSPLDLFLYEHPSDFTNSVAFVDLRRGVNVGMAVSSFPPRLAGCVAIHVGESNVSMVGNAWIFSAIDDESRRTSYFKYHLLLAGHLLTNPVFAPSTIALTGIADTLSRTHEYVQFSEPFEILGEINSRSTVLDTLLSCYHVLENYMIRAQIARVVGDGTASTLFGIRNFKQLEIAVQSREAAHLADLIKASWDKEIGGQTFKNYVRDRFQALFNHPEFVESELQTFLQRLTAKATGQHLNTSDLDAACGLLPKLLYQVRCSVVHNKETEFHLSNRELYKPTVRLTLTELCLPAMQRLAFGLPSVPSPNPVLYSRPALRLY